MAKQKPPVKEVRVTLRVRQRLAEADLIRALYSLVRSESRGCVGVARHDRACIGRRGVEETDVLNRTSSCSDTGVKGEGKLDRLRSNRSRGHSTTHTSGISEFTVEGGISDRRSSTSTEGSVGDLQGTGHSTKRAADIKVVAVVCDGVLPPARVADDLTRVVNLETIEPPCESVITC